MRNVAPLSAFVLCYSSILCSAAEPAARVEVVPLMITGEQVDSGTVDLVQPATRKSYRDRFKKWNATDIPYGEYILTIESPGFRKHQQNLRVYQPKVSVRVGLRIAMMADEPPRIIHGRITAADLNTTELWVKLVSMLADGPPMDARVLEDGTFAFGGIDPGEYVLMVIQGKTLVQAKQMMLFGGESVDIPLGPPKSDR